MAFKPEQKVFLVGSAIFLMLIVTFYSLGFIKAADDEGIGLIPGSNAVKVCFNGACYAGSSLNQANITTYINKQVDYDNLEIGSTYDDLVSNLATLNKDRDIILGYLKILDGNSPKSQSAADSQLLLIGTIEKILNEIDKKCEDLKAAIDKLPEPMKPEEPKPIPPKPMPMPMPTPPVNPIIPPMIPVLPSGKGGACNSITDVDLKKECEKCRTDFSQFANDFRFEVIKGKCGKKDLTADDRTLISEYFDQINERTKFCNGLKGKDTKDDLKCESLGSEINLTLSQLSNSGIRISRVIGDFADSNLLTLDNPNFLNFVEQQLNVDTTGEIDAKNKEIEAKQKQIDDKGANISKLEAEIKVTNGLAAKVALIKKLEDAQLDLANSKKELEDLKKELKDLQDAKANDATIKRFNACKAFFQPAKDDGKK